MKALIITTALLATLASPAIFAESELANRASLANRATVRTCSLEATDAGFRLGAAGSAQFVKHTRGEGFGVRVEAKVEDKTMLILSVATTESGRNIDVGPIYMFMGVGTFEAQTVKEPQLGLFPVDGITTVSVRLGSDVLLVGQCGVE